MTKEKRGIVMKKLLALLTAALMIVLLAVPAAASGTGNPGSRFVRRSHHGGEPTNSTTFGYKTDGKEATGTETQLHKYLVVDKNVTSPKITFKYEIAAGTAATPAEASKLPVYAGLNPGDVVVSDVEFAQRAANAEGAAGDGITNDNNKKYAEGVIIINFKKIIFPKPGVYRYILTEKAENEEGIGGVIYDKGGDRTRTIDVYVEDDDTGSPAVTEAWIYDGTEYATMDEATQAATQAGGTAEDVTHREAAAASASNLQVVGYVAYKGTISGRPDQQYTPNGYAGRYANGAADGSQSLGEKSNKIINEIQMNTATVKKVITGNQGDKESTWSIKVEFTGLPTGYNVKYAKIEEKGAPVANPTYADYTSGTALTYGHSDKYKFIGIPEGAKYTVTENYENTEGYQTTYANKEYTFPSDTRVEDKDDAVVTNKREGTIPTGIALGITGGVVLLALAVVYFVIRRRLSVRDEY